MYTWDHGLGNSILLGSYGGFFLQRCEGATYGPREWTNFVYTSSFICACILENQRRILHSRGHWSQTDNNVNTCFFRYQFCWVNSNCTFCRRYFRALFLKEISSRNVVSSTTWSWTRRSFRRSFSTSYRDPHHGDKSVITTSESTFSFLRPRPDIMFSRLPCCYDNHQ